MRPAESRRHRTGGKASQGSCGRPPLSHCLYAGAARPQAASLPAYRGRAATLPGCRTRAPLAGKRLHLLREVLPGIRRLAIFANGENSQAVTDMNDVRGTAHKMGSTPSHPKSEARRRSRRHGGAQEPHRRALRRVEPLHDHRPAFALRRSRSPCDCRRSTAIVSMSKPRNSFLRGKLPGFVPPRR